MYPVIIKIFAAFCKPAAIFFSLILTEDLSFFCVFMPQLRLKTPEMRVNERFEISVEVRGTKFRNDRCTGVVFKSALNAHMKKFKWCAYVWLPTGRLFITRSQRRPWKNVESNARVVSLETARILTSTLSAAERG